MSLAVAQLLSKQPPQMREVAIEGYGVFFAIGRSTAERTKFVNQFLDARGQPDPVKLEQRRERLLVWGTVNERGEPVFSDADLPALKVVDTAKTEALVRAIRELNDIQVADFEVIPVAPASATEPAPPAAKPTAAPPAAKK
ncbi:MAG: hypothetical protein ACKVT0_14695 [Planctomycetaceae bacterium]